MYLVSACLVGVNCRYDGGNNFNKIIQELMLSGRAIAICPEILGGLSTPRTCCEIITDNNGNCKVVSKDGDDFTKEFVRGAEKTLEIAKIIGIKKAILQSRSPSCGYGYIYDGTFSRTFKKGSGITAELLAKNSIKIFTENDLETLDL